MAISYLGGLKRLCATLSAVQGRGVLLFEEHLLGGRYEYSSHDVEVLMRSFISHRISKVFYLK